MNCSAVMETATTISKVLVSVSSFRAVLFGMFVYCAFPVAKH